ncbi:hypothetical protein Gpo141_00007781 [Globisporangium polare]
MQAAQGYQDLLHATRAQLEANGQLDKWRQQQQQQQQQHEQASQASKIARIEICGRCQGHRIEKVEYQQHMVLERTCSQCNGEGVITEPEPPTPSPAPPLGLAARSRTQSRTAASTKVSPVQSA